MSDTGMSDAAVPQYAIELDGSKYSEHANFADAFKVALLLREKHPDSKITLRDLLKSDTNAVASQVAA